MEMKWEDLIKGVLSAFIRDLAAWCQDNNLSLNVINTKGDDCGLQKTEDRARPHSHRRAAVEQVEGFKFLGVHITQLS